MNKKIILDASALLAVLNQEIGHEQVEKVLSVAVMSSVNVSEVVTVLSDVGIPSEEAESLVLEIVKEIIPFDVQQAFVVATLRKTTKQYGLSLGDRSCLALAKTEQALVLTADKIWSKLNIKDIEIQVIR